MKAHCVVFDDSKKHIGSTYVSASIMCMTKVEIVYGYTEYFVFPRCTV